jgi:prevent-host-death family protein
MGANAVNVHYAKTHLSALLRRVRQGESVTIAHAGTPVARLVPVEHGGPRRPGGVPFVITKAWFEPLPEEDLESWEK